MQHKGRSSLRKVNSDWTVVLTAGWGTGGMEISKDNDEKLKRGRSGDFHCSRELRKFTRGVRYMLVITWHQTVRSGDPF